MIEHLKSSNVWQEMNVSLVHAMEINAVSRYEDGRCVRLCLSFSELRVAMS